MRNVIISLLVINTATTAAMLLSRRVRNWATPLITGGLLTGPELAQFYGLPE